MKKIHFLLATFLVLAGCLPPRLFLPPRPTPESLINQLQKHSQRITGLKGLASIQIRFQNKSFHAEEILFLRRPAWLRAEILSPLGTSQFYIVTDGEELKIYHPAQNKYYQGKAEFRHFSSFFPLPMSFPEIVSFLLGDPLLIDYETAEVFKAEGEPLWILELRHLSSGRRQALWMDPFNFHIHRAEVFAGDFTYNLTFADFQRLGPELFPQKIEYTSPFQQARLVVTYKEIVLNPSWSTEDFFLPIPRGAKIIYWD